MSTARFLCIGLLVLFGPGRVAAQDPQQPPARRGDPGQRTPEVRTVKPAELANALDQYALIQAQRALQLNDSQHAQFVPRLKALQQTRRRNQQARNRIIHQLRELAGPRATAEADEATLTQHLTALRDHDERAARELRAAHDAVDELLTVKQRARFRLFEENIESRKLDLLMRARGRGSNPGGQ